jgi:hypothetical protein
MFIPGLKDCLYKHCIIILEVWFLMVSFYCVIASELLVLTHDILGVMIYKEQNSEITKSSSNLLIKKVKCTLVQALRLCTGRTAHRGSRGIALLFHDHWH